MKEVLQIFLLSVKFPDILHDNFYKKTFKIFTSLFSFCFVFQRTLNFKEVIILYIKKKSYDVQVNFTTILNKNISCSIIPLILK